MNDMESVVRFSANFINCYTEDDVPVIGIGDDPNEPEHYIIISQFIDIDESIDESIGFQGHFFDAEVSNAISKLELNKNQLLINIKSDKVEKIKAHKIHIKIDVSKEKFQLLIEYIQNIFSQSTVVIEITNT